MTKKRDHILSNGPAGFRAAGRRSRRLLAVAFAIVGLSGCASVPSQEMADARVAVRAAEKAGAAQIVPSRFLAAVTSVEAAAERLEERRFDDARALATSARSDAHEARRVALEFGAVEDRLEQLRSEGRDVTEAIAEFEGALREARSGRESDALARLARARALLD